jgi:pilus assembly protein FimV
MVRKSSLVLALALSIAASSAQALGLGDIRLKSALNQTFNADIELLSVEKGTLDDVRVELASPEAFEQAGVERPYLLTRLRFKPERLADGSAIVRVTSREPVREPFLNFVIEVNWPKGRLLREYTVLLDPPVTLERKPAPVAAPVVAEEPAEAPEMVEAEEPAPAATTAAAPRSTVRADEVAWAEDTGAAGEYGPVKKGESLWVISQRSQHQGVDLNQMMMAIYNANPDAFFNNNINNLKAGQILRIPDREETMQVSRGEARSQYGEHVAAWMAEKEAQQTAAAEVQAEAPAEAEAKAAPAEAEAPGEAAPVAEAAPEAKAPEAELKIATARPEGEGEAGAAEEESTESAVARLKQELLIAQEDAESARQEGEEMHSRVVELESQLADLQRLLTLKSEQLAQLQAGVAEAEQMPAEAAEAVTEEVPAEAEAVAEAPAAEMAEAEAPTTEAAEAEMPAAAPEEEEVVVDIPEAEEAAMAPAPEAEMAMEEPAAPTAEAPTTAQVEQAAAQAEQVAPPVTAPEVQQPEAAPEPAAKPAPEPVKEPGLLGGLLTETTAIIGSVGLILVLMLVIWLVRGRKTEQEEFEESILIEGGKESLTDTTIQEAEEVLGQTDETSFLSDFSPSDIDALQDETGEVDPLSEADVYIAYGRYQQAEELLKQAMEKEPERHALKHKMFEILYAVKNKDGFIALAEQSAGTPVQEADAAAWEKVISMGSELAPSHQLFAGAQGAGAPMAGAAEEVVAIGDEIGAETTDFDLDDIAVGGEAEEAVEGAADEMAELDLGDIAASLEDDAEAEAPVGEATDFDLELDSAFTELEGGDLDLGSESASEEQDVLVLDLGDEESSEEEKVIDFPAEEEAADELSLDQLGDDLETSGLSEGGDDDEVSTKLDLARAYLDMGDPEGAGDIIDEVLAEGNDDQKRQAQELRDQLS